ncbi:oxygen-independent coproporphyrinogen III oxidase [Balneolales bacterium ANBcel1]|nr:oxygen-independent coproporphyrinogen III oxidase [Balneolales bacterium ANBcel1]
MLTPTELVDKYSRQAPRYTSYPSALHFQEVEDPAAAAAFIEQNNRSARPLSLYIHIPFCASLCWYCGCTRVITRRPGDSSKYLRNLFREMEAMSKKLNPGHRIVQVHFGGGTPTFLTPQELRETGEKLHDLFQFDEDVEFSVEVDPRRISEDHAAALAEIGCNRVSIGIQDIHENVQEAINRIQPMAVNEQAVNWFRNAGIHHINVDLIYGLPLQSLQSFEQTLEAVKTLDPDRFAIFHYAHVPWMMPSQKLLDRYPMPDAHEKFSMLQMMVGNLTRSGYTFIGMDHFAKTGDELSRARENGTLQRNFQGYSTRADTDIYGFGMSSISQIANGYLQSIKDLDAYYGCIEAGRLPYVREYRLTRDDEIRRHTIVRLMCDLKLDFSSISETWGIDAASYFSQSIAALDDMASDGLVQMQKDGLQVTQTGRLFLRNIATAFDLYYASGENSNRYSKTV